MERHRMVTDTFIDLADTLASDYDIGEFLHMLVERCQEILRVATGGVLIESPDGSLRLAAATSVEMQDLEQSEIEHDEGPCMDAYRGGDRVVAEDLTASFGRWPKIAPLAVDIGLRAVYAFPLRLRGDRIGALNLYRTEPGDFVGEDVRLAQAFADVAAIGILQERKIAEAEDRSQHLQRALDSRVIIEQAKGMLAERAHISTEEAFDRIRAQARRNGEKVGAVCRRVIDTDLMPE